MFSTKTLSAHQREESPGALYWDLVLYHFMLMILLSAGLPRQQFRPLKVFDVGIEFFSTC